MVENEDELLKRIEDSKAEFYEELGSEIGFVDFSGREPVFGETMCPQCQGRTFRYHKRTESVFRKVCRECGWDKKTRKTIKSENTLGSISELVKYSSAIAVLEDIIVNNPDHKYREEIFEIAEEIIQKGGFR